MKHKSKLSPVYSLQVTEASLTTENNGRQNNAPPSQMSQILIQKPAKLLLYKTKETFTEVIKLKIFRGDIILDYLGEPNVIRRVLKSKRGRQEIQCQSDSALEKLNQPLLALKTKGTTS